jgi:hypothetical protein
MIFSTMRTMAALSYIFHPSSFHCSAIQRGKIEGATTLLNTTTAAKQRGLEYQMQFLRNDERHTSAIEETNALFRFETHVGRDEEAKNWAATAAHVGSVIFVATVVAVVVVVVVGDNMFGDDMQQMGRLVVVVCWHSAALSEGISSSSSAAAALLFADMSYFRRTTPTRHTRARTRRSVSNNKQNVSD